MAAERKGDKTRRVLLDTAFEVMYRKGFQAAGLNEVLELAGLTKGAMYHHFSGKIALGHAVVEEVVGELIERRWIEPLTGEGDALNVIPRAMRTAAGEMDELDIIRGCPLGNLATEMSALDDGFARRIDAIYQKWRDALAAALAAGQVAADDPPRIAAFIVAALAGCLAQAKAGGGRDLLLDGITELEFYLHHLGLEGAERPAAHTAAQPPEPEPEPESPYAPAPPPGELEDYLL
jgi:AcrR family transcriptional regulator